MSDSDAPQGARSHSGDPSDPAGLGAGSGRRSSKLEGQEAKPKRRAKVKKRHTVGRVLLVTSVVLAMVTGL